MKSRRLTIFCVAMIALVGTPRAWQEFSKLLSLVQHKAQVKFWSMVLQPTERESSNTQLIAAARPLDGSAAEIDSNCPSERSEPQIHEASSSSKTERRANSASPQPKARVQQWQLESRPASHASLLARAPKAQGEDDSTEHPHYFRGAPTTQPLSTAASIPPPPVVYGAAALAPLAVSKSDAYRVVMVPAIDPAAMSLIEKETTVQLKFIRKSLEDSKLSRPKGRLRAS
jgi:hypothetical protein